MRVNKQKGFSLVELVIALAVLSIVLSLAAPSFSDSMQNARISARYNEMVSAMQLARSEAVKRNTPVAICARDSDSTCGNAWGNGLLVFVDNGATPNSLEADEEILRIVEPAQVGTVINAQGSTSASSPYIVRTNIRFGPSGISNWRGGGAVQVCDQRGDESMRALFVNLDGGIKRARRDQQDEVITPWGGTLTC